MSADADEAAMTERAERLVRGVEAAAELLFAQAFMDAVRHGRVRAEARPVFLAMFRTDPDGAREALAHRWKETA